MLIFQVLKEESPNHPLQDERSRLMRRTVMRYANLSIVLTLCMISPRVKKRFPTLEHLVETGNG